MIVRTPLVTISPSPNPTILDHCGETLNDIADPLATLTMPGEVIDRPNPQAVPSHIPDVVEQLQVQLQHTTLDEPAYDALMKFRRAANYIAAGELRSWTNKRTG